MSDLLLKNVKIVVSGNFTKSVDILLKNGIIKKISPQINSNNCKIIHGKGRLIIPGLIDPHVHMREPGLVYKEGFQSGSASCLAGGVTTFLDMPNTLPPTNSSKRLSDKIALAKKKSLVNFGFHFGTSSRLIMPPTNIASTKIFFNSTTGDLQATDEKILDYYFRISPIISVHAENESINKAISYHNRYRHNKLYICHISSKYELGKALKAKLIDKNIFLELTPHHLFFTQSNHDKRLYMKPPLGDIKDREFLLKSLSQIDTIGSDHAPHTLEEKLSQKAYGIPGTQTILYSMFKLVEKEIITLSDLQKLTSSNPAKIFGLKQKGQIKIGYDADIVMINHHKKIVIKDSHIKSKSSWSPFCGFIIKGSINMVLLAGKIAYHHGEINKSIRGREVCFEKKSG